MGRKSGKLFLRAGEVGFSLNLRPGWVSVRREGGSQLREQASQDPSAECAHSWGVRGTQKHAGEWWEKSVHGICWYYGLNCVLKRYEALTTSTCECDLIWEWSLCRRPS